MKNLKLLYHGSPNKIVGGKLIPKKAKDLGEVKTNTFKGVYATDIKDVAIAMGIVGIIGVKGASADLNASKKTIAIIYQGWPKKNYFYLYTLPIKNFKRTSKNSHQWVSLKRVKPLKGKKLLFTNYSHLVRKATQDEKEKWLKKYRGKIK